MTIDDASFPAVCTLALVALGLAQSLSAAPPAQQTAEAPATLANKPSSLWVFFGTYTSGNSQGIYASRLDLAEGKLSSPELVAETANPSFLAIHPSGKYVYAVNEVADYQGEKSGAVSGFRLDRTTGKLTELNQQSSRGAAPCHVIVDPSGKNLLLANYTGGSVAVLPIQEDGSLGPASDHQQHVGSSVHPRRQKEPHAHSINLTPDARHALAADLGLDKVLIYRFDADQGKLEPHDPAAGLLPPGSGPRHLAFHTSGRFAYVINELSSTVTAFAYDPQAVTLQEIQTISTLPEPVSGNSTAEVVVHPSGKFLYGSNRGHDSLAIFTIDPATGRLTRAGHQPTGGKTPRNFAIDPSGAYLLAANQGSNSVVVFRIDGATGGLRPTGNQIQVGAPVCIKFLAVD
jgi:6-phosphogluconolactonase